MVSSICFEACYIFSFTRWLISRFRQATVNSCLIYREDYVKEVQGYLTNMKSLQGMHIKNTTLEDELENNLRTKLYFLILSLY